MDLETLINTKSKHQESKSDTNLFGRPKSQEKKQDSPNQISEGKEDQLDAISNVTPFFAQEQTYQSNLSKQLAQSTAQMKLLAEPKKEDFTPLEEYLTTENIGKIIPNELFPLFLHYFHRKVKMMITHPRPTKYYLSSEPWGFKQFEHKKDIPKDTSISLKKFFGQEIDLGDDKDVYRKRFIDRVLRKGPLKSHLTEKGYVTKEKGGIVKLKAMGIEIAEGEFMGIHDFITALENPLPSEKKKNKAYSFGAGVSEIEKQTIFREEIENMEGDIRYSSPASKSDLHSSSSRKNRFKERLNSLNNSNSQKNHLLTQNNNLDAEMKVMAEVAEVSEVYQDFDDHMEELRKSSQKKTQNQKSPFSNPNLEDTYTPLLVPKNSINPESQIQKAKNELLGDDIFGVTGVGTIDLEETMTASKEKEPTNDEEDNKTENQNKKPITIQKQKAIDKNYQLVQAGDVMSLDFDELDKKLKELTEFVESGKKINVTKETFGKSNGGSGKKSLSNLSINQRELSEKEFGSSDKVFQLTTEKKHSLNEETVNQAHLDNTISTEQIMNHQKPPEIEEKYYTNPHKADLPKASETEEQQPEETKSKSSSDEAMDEEQESESSQQIEQNQEAPQTNEESEEIQTDTNIPTDNQSTELAYSQTTAKTLKKIERSQTDQALRQEVQNGMQVDDQYVLNRVVSASSEEQKKELIINGFKHELTTIKEKMNQMEGVLSKILYKLESLPDKKVVLESKSTQTNLIKDHVHKKLKALTSKDWDHSHHTKKSQNHLSTKHKPPRKVSFSLCKAYINLVIQHWNKHPAVKKDKFVVRKVDEDIFSSKGSVHNTGMYHKANSVASNCYSVSSIANAKLGKRKETKDC